MNGLRQIRISNHKSDVELVEKYSKAVQHLCGLVDEMTVKNPALLLSPVMRELLIDHAAMTSRLCSALTCSARLTVDNAGGPLQVQDGAK